MLSMAAPLASRADCFGLRFRKAAEPGGLSRGCLRGVPRFLRSWRLEGQEATRTEKCQVGAAEPEAWHEEPSRKLAAGDPLSTKGSSSPVPRCLWEDLACLSY